MKNNRLFMDVHILQSLPPSNVNRDDTGSPKSAQYGGVKRARVSSQSWKRAMRKYFYENTENELLGKRTYEVGKYIAEKVVEIDPSLEKTALKLVIKSLKDVITLNKEGKTSALFFIGNAQAKQIAQYCVDGKEDKQFLMDIFKNNTAIDVALFGRMLAGKNEFTIEASSQVAHAISTHSIETEYDYFTAVDEINEENSTGAGMIGTIEFNSATYYRYANIAIHDFINQIKSKEDALNAIGLYLKAFALSLPSGKINTFANDTIPGMIIITFRDDRPVNLVSGFENPVSSKEGYLVKSQERLIKEFNKISKMVNKPKSTFVLDMNNINVEDLDSISEDNLNDLVSDIKNVLDDYM